MFKYQIYLPMVALLATKICITAADDKDVEFLIKFLQSTLGQTNITAIGEASEFKEYVLNDDSNDEIGTSDEYEIIERSGYYASSIEIRSDDGYLTKLTRIENPLVADIVRSPPVMLMHGGLTDPTMYVWASAKQHHPEPWPRKPEDGPITSWNRSLAFTLANNGFDVWLVGTRGCNEHNQGHLNYSAKTKISERSDYWEYSMDEIIEKELPKQIEAIIENTGAEKVSLIAVSMSTQITLSMLGSNEDIASKIHSYICIAPILNNIGTNNMVKFLNLFTYYAPVENGTQHLLNLAFSEASRKIILNHTDTKSARYYMGHALTNALFGPSRKYQTFLEKPVIGNLFKPMSFKQVKHWSQQVMAGQLQKFNYGVDNNEKLYHQSSPPAYDISDIHVKDWMVISGSNDKLSTTESVEQLLRTVNPEPLKNVIIDGYNHLDLVAAFDVDVRVNLIVLEFLDKLTLNQTSKTH